MGETAEAGYIKEAGEDMTTALRLTSQSNPHVLMMAGHVNIKLGNIAEAEEKWQACASIDAFGSEGKRARDAIRQIFQKEQLQFQQSLEMLEQATGEQQALLDAKAGGANVPLLRRQIHEKLRVSKQKIDMLDVEDSRAKSWPAEGQRQHSDMGELGAPLLQPPQVSSA